MTIQGYEYFDEGNESLRDPDTYLGASPLVMVKQFMRIMGQSLGHEYVQNSKLDLLRLCLLKEEVNEASAPESAENLLKELADVIYVTYGYAAAFGWDLDEALRRVHASNMSKLGDDGQPIYRDDGKVKKGPNYQKPDLSDLV